MWTQQIAFLHAPAAIFPLLFPGGIIYIVLEWRALEKEPFALYGSVPSNDAMAEGKWVWRFLQRARFRFAVATASANDLSEASLCVQHIQ